VYNLSKNNQNKIIMKELREEIAQAKKIISLTPKMDEILTEAKIGSYNPCLLEYHNILESLLDTAAEMGIELIPVRGSQTSNRFEIGQQRTTIEVGYNMTDNRLVGVLVSQKGIVIFIQIGNNSRGILKRVKKALEIATM
jgi:hypothetical protein